MDFKFASVPEALEEIKAGRPLIMVDNEDRENEGDFVLAAQKASIENINFIIKEGRGLVCAPVSQAIAQDLDLPLMVIKNTDPHQTAFTVSIDAVKNTTTGISASDRYETLIHMANPQAKPQDFRRPGHIFPLIAKEGGVLVRAGHTEGSIDLVRMAGFNEVSVICEILKENGEMARLPDLIQMAQKFNLKIISIEDIILWRKKTEKTIQKVSQSFLPTQWGQFLISVYQNTITKESHVALIKGEINANKPILVRVHSECLTGDVLGSSRCDCGPQLHAAIEAIEEAEQGVLLYLRQEGRGIGLENKIKAYHLQDQGLDTVQANEALGFPPDLRDYGIGAQILKDIGVGKIKLLTNNPKKIIGLKAYDLEVVERVPIIIKANQHNKFYLNTKKQKMGHMLDENK